MTDDKFAVDGCAENNRLVTRSKIHARQINTIFFI